jgi:hypothetical protein
VVHYLMLFAVEHVIEHEIAVIFHAQPVLPWGDPRHWPADSVCGAFKSNQINSYEYKNSVGVQGTCRLRLWPPPEIMHLTVLERAPDWQIKVKSKNLRVRRKQPKR